METLAALTAAVFTGLGVLLKIWYDHSVSRRKEQLQEDDHIIDRYKKFADDMMQRVALVEDEVKKAKIRYTDEMNALKALHAKDFTDMKQQHEACREENRLLRLKIVELEVQINRLKGGMSDAGFIDRGHSGDGSIPENTD